MAETRPVIGLTLDWNAAGAYSQLPWYALRENYAQAVIDGGGLPVMLAHEPDLAVETIDHLQGLIVTGGDFDVDPTYYGENKSHWRVETKDRRTAYELAILKAALDRDMPVLGICGGQQLLNVALGGTLIQHIPDAVPDCLAHEQPTPRTQAGHEVQITEGTLLSRIVGTATMRVNSAHHQAAKTVGPQVVVNAMAPDGVIEGIEAVGPRFCLGVQWHPEYAIDPGDTKIITALVTAAAGDDIETP